MPGQSGASGQVLPGSAGFDAVIAQIFEGAAERDANPVFPHQPFRVLSEAGLLALPVPNPPETRGRLISFGEEWRILRTVA